MKLIDGFKRLAAARSVSTITTLVARLVEADERVAKAAIHGLKRVERRTHGACGVVLISRVIQEPYNNRMSLNQPKRESRDSARRRFLTTHWSVVLAAGRAGSADSRQALATLCETYWYPLYAFVRRRGYGADDAQDLTQEFFATLLEKDFLKAADRQRGKFRSFLVASLNHFLANQWRRASVRKRGGDVVHLSFDFTSGENRYKQEPAHELTAEKIFERRWALTLLDQTFARLRAEYGDVDKLDLYEQLKVYLGGDKTTVPYRQLAADLGMTEGAVKVAVHRLRKRCRVILRDEISQTVARPEEVDEELRDLFRVFGQ